ncbi:MAG: xylulokinase [Dehalococcoidia bacterium]
MEYTLGIDLGTTGVRVLLISEIGDVVATGNGEYPLLMPEPYWTEQDSEQWWQATAAAIKACLEIGKQAAGSRIKVAAIGLSGQMHGSVFLGSKGEVLRPAILWNDQRTADQCEQITAIVGEERLIRLTSNRALAGFTAPKILWLKQNEPDIYAQVNKILLPKDYLRYRLTGILATEVSDASGTLLFNVRERKWSEEMLQALELPSAWMPECYESVAVSGHISRESAAITGLTSGTPVVGGAGDQAAGAVGNGIVSTGKASCVLGTSGVLFWHCDTYTYDPQARLHSFCHAVPGKWHLMAVTMAAGGSLRWFRDSLCQDIKAQAKTEGIDPYEIIIGIAERITAGSEGLLFLPYLAGERTPYANPHASGAFIGLSLRHTRAHMARAVMEGITMSLRDCLELGRKCGATAPIINFSGGGARSSLWQQMAADIFGVSVQRSGSDEGPAYGAAILANVGAGLHRTVEEACATFIKIKDEVQPQYEMSERYSSLYGLYTSLYPSLLGFYEQNASFIKQYS